jgi:hypothetical protein
MYIVHVVNALAKGPQKIFSKIVTFFDKNPYCI